MAKIRRNSAELTLRSLHTRRDPCRKCNSKKKPFHFWKGWQVAEAELAAYDVCCLETLGAFQQVELNGFTLVERAVAVFLYGGEVDEDVFAS